MRTLVLAVIATAAVTVVSAPGADACVRASEANRLLGWSEDGSHALLGLFADDGRLEHAEILPTAYQGSVMIVNGEGGEVVVTKVKVGACADFGDDAAAVVERRPGPLTEAVLRDLPAVKAMRFGTVERPAVAGPLPTARITGAKRYAVHDLAITDAAGTTTVPVPVWCVGSCLRDEKWKAWKATVAAVHTLPSGMVLHEVRLTGVCNGGTAIRLVQARPPKVKVPRRRCTGSG